MPVVTMLDATSANEPNIPSTTKKVAGYTTQIGKVRIQWTPEQFATWSAKAGVVPVNQDPLNPGATGVTDCETGAYSIKETISRAKALGVTYPGTYIQESELNNLVAAWEAASLHPADIWLANWNLNQAEATAKIGTVVGPFTIKAVQWASPTSNPNTIVPGGTQPLRIAQVDISVADSTWFPAPVSPVPPPAPVTASVTVVLESTDGGKTWKVA